MTRIAFLLIFLAAALTPSEAQLYLQMERYGQAKVTKFAPGTELTYRLAGRKEWETAVLERILPEENKILLGIHYLDPAQIEAIRSFHPRRWSRPIGTNLYAFGASWTGFSLGAWVADRNDPYSAGDAIVTATALASGFMLQQLFRHKTYRMGEKRRLRILDMRVQPSR